VPAPLRALSGLPGLGRILGLLREADPRAAHDPVLLFRTSLPQASIFAFDSATLWVLIRAVGGTAGPGAVFASFMVASLLRTVGFMPGGLGTFEAASVSALALAGVPVPIGLSATLLFRGLSFWMPMLPGFAVSRHLRAQGSPAAARRRGELLFAAVVSLITGEWVGAAIVVAIFVASTAVGYVREYRAQIAAERLRERVQVCTTVMRDRAPLEVRVRLLL
jgi:Mg2+-importing ATPase